MSLAYFIIFLTHSAGSSVLARDNCGGDRTGAFGIFGVISAEKKKITLYFYAA